MTHRTSDPVALHLFIQGRVQGVGYRCATRDQAARLGLAGWVRNHANGEVEAWFEGDRPTLDRMVQWCHQGPPAARVTAVLTEEVAPQGYGEFRLRRSV